jgi:thiol-disulfide isomerase/thioredoxin
MFLIIGTLFFSVIINAQEIKKIKITELEQTIKESEKPLIVNFWATYCVPCIEEMPYFLELSKKYEVELLLVSLDLQDFYPDKIKKFAAKNKFTAPLAWLDEYDADYFCPKVDTTWSGAIPASLFINNQTGYRKFIEEELSKDKLEKEIMAILGKEN